MTIFSTLRSRRFAATQTEETKPEYARMLEQGSACLLEGASDCDIHFEKALR